MYFKIQTANENVLERVFGDAVRLNELSVLLLQKLFSENADLGCSVMCICLHVTLSEPPLCHVCLEFVFWMPSAHLTIRLYNWVVTSILAVFNGFNCGF